MTPKEMANEIAKFYIIDKHKKIAFQAAKQAIDWSNRLNKSHTQNVDFIINNKKEKAIAKVEHYIDDIIINNKTINKKLLIDLLHETL